MSIAIPTYAPGAISSYSELVTEVRDLMDDADYPQVAIDRALRKAEAEFNRSLRTPDMETRVILNVTGETTALPEDFLQMRSIYSEGSPDRPMSSMAPGTLAGAFGGYAGTPSAFAIQGKGLRVLPVGTATLEMEYFAAIPPLSDARISNWLLVKHPDLYVSGVMYHLAIRERDKEAIAERAQEMAILIEKVKGEAQRNRWGAGPLIPMGIQQVRYIRA